VGTPQRLAALNQELRDSRSPNPRC